MVRRAKLPTTEEMAQHVRDLAKAFQVVLLVNDELRHEDAVSLHAGEKHLVAVKPIKDETTYAVALHELGHCIAPLGTVGNDGYEFKILREVSAWEWAEHYALDWTPTMQAVRLLCLDSYEQSRKRQEQEDKRHSPAAVKSFLKKVGI